MRGTAKAVVTLEGFALFWSIYPRHIAKRQAQRTWDKLKASPELVNEIMKLLRLTIETEWKDRIRRGRLDLIPHPGTWLNREDFMAYMEEKETDEGRMVIDDIDQGHMHSCGFCGSPHHWLCDDDLCSYRGPLACAAFRNRRARG